MVREHRLPVTIQVYLGSGERAEKLRTNLEKASKGGSLSRMIVDLLKRADPTLFKGVDNGSKK